MSKENIKTIKEIIDGSERQQLDSVFEELLQEQNKLLEKVMAAMEIEPKPECEPYHEVASLDGKAISRIYTFHGPKVDHLCCSSVVNRELGFSNLHLNIWVSPELRVPGFGCVFGTLPALFHYNDFVPRYDLWHEIQHLDEYYMPVNDQYLDFVGKENITPFISQDTYIRTAASPMAVGVMLENNQPNRDMVVKFANERMDTWLDWMAEARPTPMEQQQQLADRDYRIRLANAHRDPANPVAFRMFGVEQGYKMLEQLWGVNWDDRLYDGEPEVEGMTLKEGGRF